MNYWGIFYIVAVALTLIHSLIPIRPMHARHHTLGAEIITASWLASWGARSITGDATPLELYALIDVVTAFLFLLIAVNKKAVWAAVCVILHTAMLVLHLAGRLTGEVNETGYIWILNSLFLMALLTINGAIFAGRHVWGFRFDQFVMARLRNWSWTGLRSASVPDHQKEVV